MPRNPNSILRVPSPKQIGIKALLSLISSLHHIHINIHIINIFRTFFYQNGSFYGSFFGQSMLMEEHGSQPHVLILVRSRPQRQWPLENSLVLIGRSRQI